MPTAPINEVLAPGNDIEQVLPNEAQQMLRALERAFAQSFTVIDCSTGNIARQAMGGPKIDLYKRLSVCQQVADRGRPEILDEVSPIVLLGVPLIDSTTTSTLLAVAPFVTERVQTQEEIAAAAQEFELSAKQAFHWAAGQTPWPAKALQELSAAVAEKATLQLSAAQLKRQMADISSHLLMTFEEITLLHRLTEHLSISKSVTDICELSV